MAREEKCVSTNMCMVYDENGNVLVEDKVGDDGNRILVQDRMNPNWPGITFPGGHIEPKESFVESVIRERNIVILFSFTKLIHIVENLSLPMREKYFGQKEIN